MKISGTTIANGDISPPYSRYMPTSGLVVEEYKSKIRLVFDDPAKKNPINRRAFALIPEIVEKASLDPEILLLEFTGADGNFSSGADVRDFSRDTDGGGGLEENQELSGKAFAAIANCPKLTLALIEGFCVGSGVSIAAACDFRVANPTAVFAIPATKLGIVYPVAEMRRLCAIVGISGARKMLFRPGRLTSAEAIKLGLVDELHVDLEAASAVFLKELEGQSGPAIHGAKLAINSILTQSTAAYEKEIDRLRAHS